jgi:hypothetical protein
MPRTGCALGEFDTTETRPAMGWSVECALDGGDGPCCARRGAVRCR